jgi:hypothetical protein
MNDTAGNVNVTETVTITVTDNDAPTYSWVNKPTSGTTGESVLVNISVSDNIAVDKVNITVDGVTYPMTQAGSYWTYTINIPSDSTASIVYNVSMNDTAGNVNVTETVTITVTDNDAPTIDPVTLNISTPVKVGVSVLINATVIDNIQVDTVSIFVNGSPLAVTATPPYYTAVYTAGSGDGVLVVNVTANDSLGNFNYNDTQAITLDNTPPSVYSILAPAPGAYLSGVTVVNVSISDVNGVASVKFLVFNQSGVNVLNLSAVLSSGSSADGNWSNASFDTTQLPDGAYNIYVWAVDVAGNVNSSVNVSVFVDNTPPSVVPLYPAGGSTLSGTTYVNASASDVLSGLGVVLFRFENSTWSGSWQQVNTTFNTLALSDGFYNISFYANDTAGNVNSTEKIYSVLVDNSPPSVSGVQSNATVVRTGAWIRVNATVVDSGVGVDNNSVFVLNESMDVVAQMQNVSSPVFEAVVQVSYSGEGQHNYTVNASDLAGNYNDTESIIITVDNTPPGVFIMVPYPDEILRGLIIINVTVNDTNGVSSVWFEFSNQSGSQANITATLTSGDIYNGNWSTIYNTTQLSDDFYRLGVYANDTAGNLNPFEYVNVTVDNTPPTITLTYPPSGFNVDYNYKTNNVTLQLNYTVSNPQVNYPQANISTCQLWHNFSGTWEVNDSYLAQGTSTHVWNVMTGANGTFVVNTSLLSDGNYAWNVWCNDSVGNSAFSTANYTISVGAAGPNFVQIRALKQDGGDTAYPTIQYYFYDNQSVLFNVTVSDSNGVDTLMANFSQLGGSSSFTAENITCSGSKGDTTRNCIINYTIPSGSNLSGSAYIPLWANDTTGAYSTTDMANTPVAVMNIEPRNIDPTLDGATTWWKDIDDFTNVTNLTFENSTYGKIVFLEPVNLTDNDTINSIKDLANKLNISMARMDLDAAVGALASLNVTSELVMYNLPFTTQPGILHNGVPVLQAGQNVSAIVNIVSWVGGNLTFNVTGWSTYQADGAPPQGYITSIAPNVSDYYVGGVIAVNFSVGDVGGGSVAAVTLTVRNSSGDIISVIANDSAQGFTVTTTSLVDGVHYLILNATDTLGNHNASIDNRTVYVDNTKPSVFFLQPSAGQEVKNTISINVSVQDVGVGVKEVKFNITNSTGDQVGLLSASLISGSINNGNWSVSWDTTSVQDGYYNITAIASDNLSNINSTVYVTVSVDNTAPVITVLSPQNGSYISDATPLLNVSFDDYVNWTWISVDGGAGQNYSSNTLNLTLDLPSLADGTHNVTVFANDSLGRQASSFVYFTVDTQPPTIVGPPDNDTGQGYSLTISWNITDATSPGGYYEVYLNGTSIDSGNYTSGENVTVTVNTSTVATLNYTIWANDTAGNSNSDEVIINVKDLTAPVITVNRPLAGEIFTVSNGTTGYGNITIDYVVSDNVAVAVAWYNLSAFSQNITTGSSYSNSSIVLPDGTYTLIVYANDTAGNLATPIVRQFTVNTTYLEYLSNTTNTTISNETIIVGDNTFYNSTILGASKVVNSTVNLSVVTNSTLEESTAVDSNLSYVVAENTNISGTTLENATVYNAVITDYIISGTTGASIELNVSGISVNFTNVYTNANVSELVTSVNTSTPSLSAGETARVSNGTHPTAGDYAVNVSANKSVSGKFASAFTLINPGGQALPNQVSGTRFLYVDAPNFNSTVLNNATVCISYPPGSYTSLRVERFNGSAWEALSSWTAGTFVCANTSGFSVFGVSGVVAAEAAAPTAPGVATHEITIVSVDVPESVQPGETVSIEVTLDSASQEPDVEIMLASLPFDWTGETITVTLLPGTSTHTLHLTVPSDAEQKEYEISVRVRAWFATVSKRFTVTVGVPPATPPPTTPAPTTPAPTTPAPTTPAPTTPAPTTPAPTTPAPTVAPTTPPPPWWKTICGPSAVAVIALLPLAVERLVRKKRR